MVGTLPSVEERAAGEHGSGLEPEDDDPHDGCAVDGLRGARRRGVDQRRAAATLAAGQHGQVERTQLDALGLHKDKRRRLIAGALLHPVHDGVWSWGAPNDQPLALARAATLAAHPHGLLAGKSARWLWGWTPHLELPATVVVPRGRRRPREGVRLRLREIPDADHDLHYGIPVTSPARTVLDCAPLLTPDELDRLVADALISPYLTAGVLTEAVDAHAGRPGAPALRDVLGVAASGVTRSEVEARLRGAIVEAGLDRPRFNAEVHGHERDAVWDDLKLVVEVHGWRFHSAPRQFEQDRERDLQLATHGWQVHPVSYRMLTHHRLRTMAQLAVVIALRAAALAP